MGSSPQFKAYSALAAVYFFWGTTYVTIRLALESFAPIRLISTRFLISGAILLIAAKLMKIPLPKGRELYLTAINGLIMLGVANGCLVFAEQWIPSGLAALFITTAAFWMVGIEALLPNGLKPHGPTLLGILVGFAGVVVLVAPSAMGAPGGAGLIGGFLLLQFSSACWCLGALLQRNLTTKAHPVVSGAIQQAAVGITYFIVSLFVKEHPVRWTDRGMIALVWLIFFGSIVGYSSFIYAMEHLPAAIVATHTFVNPIVAVFLGWLIYEEAFGWREGIAMAFVFTGVALVKFFSPAAAPKTKEAEAFEVSR